MTTFLSASTLQGHEDCPRLQTAIDLRTVKKEQTPAMAAGLWRHKVIEAAIGLGLPVTREAMGQAIATVPAPADVEDQAMEDSRNGLLALADRPDLFPRQDQVLSVEGSDLPKALSCVLYGRTMFAVPLNPEITLRGAMDLVYLAEDTLFIPDWKGSGGEYPWARRVYLWAASEIWPGFARYVFPCVYVTGGCRVDSHEATPDQLSAIQADLLVMAQTIQARRVRGFGDPTPNRWCGDCPIQADCPAYGQQVTALTTMEPSALPADISALADDALLGWHRDLSRAMKLAAGFGERIKAEIKERLGAGKALPGAKVVTASGGYSYPSMEELLLWADKFELKHDLVVQAATEAGLKKAVAKLVDNDRRALCLADLDKIRAPKRRIERLVMTGVADE